MRGFITWHKLMIGKLQTFFRIDNYESLWLSWLKGLVMGIIIASLFSGCYIYDGAYYHDDSSYQNETIHYYDNNVYHGYYQGFYYYYGQPHWYPWSYYYTIIPHHTYSIHTHINILCNNGYAVNRPRGPKFNNKTVGTYTPINTSSVINKRPIRRTVRNVDNKIIPIPKYNPSRPVINNNNKVNTNRNNNKSTKVNTNRNNNKSTKVNTKKSTRVNRPVRVNKPR